MGKETFNPFAAVVNYTPRENDITLEDAINCAMKYEEKKKEKNKSFFEFLIKSSDEDSRVKDRLLYIFNNIDLLCEEDDDAYTLILESTLNGLEIYLTFELNKNSTNPSIKCTCEQNEIESIISSFLLRNLDEQDIIRICNMNLVYGNDKDYSIKINGLPIELNLSEDRIVLRTIDDGDEYNQNIFSIYPNSEYLYIDNSLPKEGYTFSIINNLSFFAKSCYVKKEDIPREILKYGCDSKTTLERLIETSDIGNDEEVIQSYYIALPNEIKELEGVEEILDSSEEETNYVCTFEDGSSLEFAKDRLFTINKRTKKFTMAEKALSLKEK